MKLRLRLVPISAIVLLACCSVLVSGCGSGSSSVEGSVSFDGSPIDSGAVVFVPTESSDKAVKIGARIQDGKYTLDSTQGLAPGKYHVILNWNKKTGRKIQNGDGAGVRDETKEGLPAKFNEATTQTADVKSGKNTIDFVLKSQ